MTNATTSPLATNVSRRRFLKNAGIAVAAGVTFPSIIPASAFGRDGNIAPSNRIALGVVGLQQGWDGFRKCLNVGKKVQGVALCDVDSERIERRRKDVSRFANAQGIRGYADFREMFASGKLDAVVLGAPDHWHGIMAVAAARAGLDIYGEKPLAHTLVEGRAIVNAVKQHGRIWQTGSWQRSQNNFRRAVELVRNGRIGKLVRVEAGTHGAFGRPRGNPKLGQPPAHLNYDLYVGPAQWQEYDARIVHYNWRWVLNFGGGNLMDWVGHHLDIAHWGAGRDNTGPVKIKPIRADYSTDLPFDAERTYEYECTYADGLVINVNSNSGTKFFGENGRWIYVNRGKLSANPDSILNEVIGPEEYQPYLSQNHWGNFIDCIKSRSETITPAETAHRSASVGHLGHIAVLTGRTITWDPVTETIKNDPGASALLQPNFRSPWVL
ncbi:MAG: Gfo/Idh/MocA family oxidoreductase [Puniceicoccales bacterium]|jgi:predicted dehydrogenase|nr:Gfo/Idh/MocA family oxidoreductase [Puniceicoccales bacterium]